MAGLPTGTVTFLFTDIEGSTRLWERDASAMKSALARHDEILRSAIEERDGHVFKTVGDAFCAAFSSAPEALDASISAQRALYDENWEEGAMIRVRMALHTGAVEEQGGDYFGPP
jgi:class 3 adenylate cyclase